MQGYFRELDTSPAADLYLLLLGKKKKKKKVSVGSRTSTEARGSDTMMPSEELAYTQK